MTTTASGQDLAQSRIMKNLLFMVVILFSTSPAIFWLTLVVAVHFVSSLLYEVQFAQAGSQYSWLLTGLAYFLSIRLC